jgi:hypothetical protein
MNNRAETALSTPIAPTLRHRPAKERQLCEPPPAGRGDDEASSSLRGARSNITIVQPLDFILSLPV